MKRIICLLITWLIATNYHLAQTDFDKIFFCSYSENNRSDEICDYLQNNLFISNESAEKAVDKILAPIGLPRNFVLVSCPDIKNAVAMTPSDGIRYVVYDNAFMENIDKSTSNWSSISILAHEIGHHLCGHTLRRSRDLEEKRKKELEADEFSGFVMQKLGASLSEAQAAMGTLAKDKDDTYSTHPSRSKRLNAIKIGYEKAATQSSMGNLVNKPSAENYFSEAKKLTEKKQYYLAIEKYSSAIQLKPDYAYAYNNRGAIKHDLKDYQGAIADYNKAIEYHSAYAFAYYNRSVVKFTIKNYNSSLQDANRAIQYDPNNALMYQQRGDVKAAINDYRGALKDYTMAINLGQKNPLNYYNRGISKKHLKDIKGMCSDFRIACNLNDSEACKALTQLCK